jgi:hypothetical protein
MLRSSPFVIAAAVFVIAAGTASAQGTPEPGEAPEMTAETPAEEARPKRGERMRERMRDRYQRHDMRPRRGMGATMPGPGIEIQIGEDRLVITCGRRETTSQCVEAAMPIIEMFHDEVDELDLDDVEDAEVNDEED